MARLDEFSEESIGMVHIGTKQTSVNRAPMLVICGHMEGSGEMNAVRSH